MHLKIAEQYAVLINYCSAFYIYQFLARSPLEFADFSNFFPVLCTLWEKPCYMERHQVLSSQGEVQGQVYRKLGAPFLTTPHASTVFDYQIVSLMEVGDGE